MAFRYALSAKRAVAVRNASAAPTKTRRLFEAARSFSMASRTSSPATRAASGRSAHTKHEVVDPTSRSKTVDRDELVVAVKPGMDQPKLAAGAGDKHERGVLEADVRVKPARCRAPPSGCGA